DRPRLRTAAVGPERAGGGRRAPRRTAGPARPRRHPRFQSLLPARRPARPAGAGADRALAEGRAVSAGEGRVRGRVLVGGAIVASLLLVGAYLAAGGSSYAPEKVQDPCKPRPWRNPEGLAQIAEQFSLSALDGAACKLGVSREALARALATPAG